MGEGGVSTVLLNGKYVAAEEIDPARHRYLGMFRPAANPLLGHRTAIVVCPLGHHLQYTEQLLTHYRDGCCDIPQYVDIA